MLCGWCGQLTLQTRTSSYNESTGGLSAHFLLAGPLGRPVLWAELAFTHMKHFAADYEAVAMVVSTNATLFLWSVVAVAV